MGSGIIFVVIVAMWAAILVPMWLRSHDAATETKSVDRFSTAMRILSRRGGPGSRDLVMPGRAREVEVQGGRAPSSSARREQAARAARMRRRRTAVMALVGFLGVILLAAVAGAAPLWLPVATVLGTVAYLAHLRIDAVNTAAAERRRRREAARAGARRPIFEAAPVPPTIRVQAPTWPVAAAAVATAPQAAPVEVESGWAPTPVVLPTYVTAPPATSVPRVIDLTHPGSWSAAHMLDHAARNAPDPDEIFDGRSLDETPAVPATYAEIAAEQEAVAATVPGSTGQGSAAHPFLDDDVVFDQDDDESLLDLLDRRATGS